MLRIRQHSSAWALVAVGIMLLTGCAALAHHDSPSTNHCVLCFVLSQGGVLTAGVSLAAPHPGLFQFLILRESHPLKFCYPKTIQARAPPASTQDLA
jgi:hypothetical protein